MSITKLRILLRILTSIAFAASGIVHILRPHFFLRMVPPMFPQPRALVSISGICEIAGGLGLLIPSLRRAAAYGLIALLIAVFPANCYMALRPDRFADLKFPTWTLWARLPFQGLFIAMVWWAGLKRRTARPLV